MAAEDCGPLDIDIGTVVYCRWQGGATYYRGTVRKRKGESIYIHYDDGDREWNVVSLIRIPATSGAAVRGNLVSLFFGNYGCFLWLLVIGGVIGVIWLMSRAIQ